MSTGSIPSYAHERLVGDVGLSADTERGGGPMGSGSWRLTNGIVDIEVYSDRGRLGVAAGRHGGRTFGVGVWAGAVGASVANSLTFEEQIDYFASTLEVITRLVQAVPEIEAKLRDINWESVKDLLGLPPDAQRDDPKSWNR